MQTITTGEHQDVSGQSAAAVDHWPALDGLRGIAVVAVVAYHLGWISGGFLGVDLFFTLSGFLITSLLVREATTSGRVDLRAFWGRRFRRLLPAAMAMIVVVLGLLAAFGTAAEQATARDDGRWALPYLANWHLVAAARDYWADATSLSVFNHLWSLSIEEQFYLCWPVVAWLVLRRRDGGRSLAVVAALGALASTAAMVVLARTAPPSRVYFGTDTRAVALLVGALVATPPVRDAFTRLRGATGRRTDLVVVGITATLLPAWCWGGRVVGLLVGGGLAVHAVLSAVLVGALATNAPPAGRWAHRSRAVVACSRRPLVWCGTRSYAIYLWHWPIIQLIEPRWTTAPAAVRDAVELLLTLAAAEASHRLVEHPIRRKVSWAAGPRASLATAALVVVAGTVAVVAPSGRGDVAGFDLATVAVPVPVAATADTDAPLPGPPPLVLPTTPATAPVSTAAAFVVVGEAAEAVARLQSSASTVIEPPRRSIRRVLWVGDSVAADEAPAVAAALGAAGVEVVDGAIDGAGLSPDDTGDRDQLYPAMVGDAAADVVAVQLSFWDSRSDVDRLRADLGWFRDLVLGSGADLVFVTPPPIRADLFDPDLAHQIEIADEFAAADPARVAVLDTAAVWGTEMHADLDGDGAPDRKPDGVHVCPQGAARLAAWLVDALDARYDGITPVFPSAWLSGPWRASDRYDTPIGACAALG